MGQHLTMTPQLQQAIRLLQLSTLDLQQEIQSALESNPMLEVEENETEALTGDNEQPVDLKEISNPDDYPEQASEDNMLVDSINNEAAVSSSDELTIQQEFSNAETTADDEWKDSSVEDTPVDTQWDDAYPPASSSATSNSDFELDFDSRTTAKESLVDHLNWQLNLTPMSETDQLIAMAIIDSLSPNGLLSVNVEELHKVSDEELDIEIDEIEAVRHRIQHFDPVGVASKDLTDCLMVQLAHLGPKTPWREEAALVITRHLNLLANRDFTQLLRRTRLKENELSEVIALIKSLNPRPGESFQDNTAEYIVPDVFVTKKEGKWVVELNPDISPKLKINNSYASLIKRSDTGADNTFLRDNLQEAKWLLKSLSSRNETLLKVATRIVAHQKGFLEHGDEAMKPLILHDIAKDVEMHESTISRVTTQKYMHTPRGIFELKYFFSSHVSTASGGECSSTAIRAIIKKFVAAENTRKPLSDNKIAMLLDTQGIKVARRTVAKYRESMQIPPSNERKQLG